MLRIAPRARDQKVGFKTWDFTPLILWVLVGVTRLPQCFVLWSSEPSDESVGSQSQKSAGLIPLLLGIRWGSASIGMNRGNRMRHLALQLPFLWWWCGSGTCSPALSLQRLGSWRLGVGEFCLNWNELQFTFLWWWCGSGNGGVCSISLPKVWLCCVLCLLPRKQEFLGYPFFSANIIRSCVPSPIEFVRL